MVIPKRTIRGVQDIRTHAGKVDKTSLPHKAYLRIACLELEKLRRDTERETAMRRVKCIDERCQEIEAEQDVLLNSLAGGKKGKVCRADRRSSVKRGQDEEMPGFKIEY